MAWIWGCPGLYLTQLHSTKHIYSELPIYWTMGKTTAGGTDTEKVGLFISLDPITDQRLDRQAARKYGTVQGYKQSYGRAAIKKSIEEDEASMPRQLEEGDNE